MVQDDLAIGGLDLLAREHGADGGHAALVVCIDLGSRRARAAADDPEWLEIDQLDLVGQQAAHLVQRVVEAGQDALRLGQPSGHLAAVAAQDLAHAIGVAALDQVADLGQRHVELAQEVDHHRDVELLETVEPIARQGVDEGGREHAGLVVAAQGLGRDPGQGGETADRDQVASWVLAVSHGPPWPRTTRRDPPSLQPDGGGARA